MAFRSKDNFQKEPCIQNTQSNQQVPSRQTHEMIRKQQHVFEEQVQSQQISKLIFVVPNMETVLQTSQSPQRDQGARLRLRRRKTRYETPRDQLIGENNETVIEEMKVEDDIEIDSVTQQMPISIELDVRNDAKVIIKGKQRRVKKRLQNNKRYLAIWYSIGFLGNGKEENNEIQVIEEVSFPEAIEKSLTSHQRRSSYTTGVEQSLAIYDSTADEYGLDKEPQRKSSCYDSPDRRVRNRRRTYQQSLEMPEFQK